MAVFIDDLAYSLFVLSFAAFLILYIIASLYLALRKNNRKEYQQRLDAARAPLILIGIFLLVMGFFGEFVWPLPGSYNILFYDCMVAFGSVILSFVLAIQFRSRFEYAGFLTLMIGIMTIAYGVYGYKAGLTEAPIALLALYFFFGAAAIFTYPLTLMVDKNTNLQKDVWIGWYFFIAAFLLSIFAAAILAGYIGIEALPAHLLNPP